MLGIAHTVHPVDVHEVVMSTGVETAMANARLKIERARSDLSAAGQVADSTILAFDTVVENDGHVFGKPESRFDASRMLRSLSGKQHKVIGAMVASLVDGSSEQSGYCVTEVTFMDLSNEMIEWYIDSGEWMGRAGSYAIQGKGSLFVDAVLGDYQNVVGLPVSLFRNLVLLSDPEH